MRTDTILPIDTVVERAVEIAAGGVMLEGSLRLPQKPRGAVLFAHGSGSSRLSPRNQYVARQLNEADLATLLIDLLSAEEEAFDLETARLRFNIGLLAQRLVGATDWLMRESRTGGLPIGYFGASTGAAAAVLAATMRADRIGAIVSRGGRPDLASAALPFVRAPTLLIVGSEDRQVIALNRAVYNQLQCVKELAIVPGATHLFEEPGTLEEVAGLASAWFQTYLVRTAGAPPPEPAV
jgi:dienelactone hydrolase